MKKYSIMLWLAFCSMTLQAQVVFSPQFPKIGEKVSFIYTPPEQFKDSPHMEAVAVFPNLQKYYESVKLELPLIKKGKNWYGEFTLKEDTKSVYLYFLEIDTDQDQVKSYDNNKNKGYTLLVYDAKNIPVQGAYTGLSSIHDKHQIQLEDPYLLTEQEIKRHPESKYLYFENYANLLLKKDRKLLAKEIEMFSKKVEPNEDNLTLMSEMYDKLGDTTKAENINKVIKQKYPEGKLVMFELVSPIFRGKGKKDETEQKRMIADFLIKFPTFEEKDYLRMLAISPDIQKALDQNDSNKLKEIINANIENIKLPQTLHNLALDYYEANKSSALTEMMSKIVVELIEKQLKNPKIRPSTTKRETIGILRYYASNYSNTYGLILYQNKKYIDANVVFAQMMKNATWLPVDHFNNYKKANLKANIALLEKMITSGQENEQITFQLKKYFIEDRTSEAEFPKYLDSLQQMSRNKNIEYLKEELIDRKTPDFTLKDLDGKTVSFKDFRGKILVIDFWATWCGPCIMSFPGMQAVIENQKDKNDVAFLFIATMDAKAEVESFMKKNQAKYSFKVLYDEGNKVKDLFGVSGIPSKFIIDKQGKTRFNETGSSSDMEYAKKEMIRKLDFLRILK